MKIFEKRFKNKMFILVLMSVCIVGIIALPTLVDTHTVSIEHNNSIPDVIPAQEIVTNIETVSLSSESTIDTFPIKDSSTPEIPPVRGVPMPIPIPSGIIYPKPTYIPSLMKYEINKDTDSSSDVNIWHAQNPKSYITQNDEWVKYVASQLYIDKDGRIRYKNTPVPYVIDFNKDVLSWMDKLFYNEYVSDDELFNFPPNSDLWQNADYYLSHGLKGDCEDWSIVTTSMMLSGEMSTMENGAYFRHVIPAKVVIGTVDKTATHAWTEYSVYGMRYISSVGQTFNQGTEKYESIEGFYPDSGPNSEWGRFRPIYQFTDKYFGKYKNDT